MTVNFRGYVFQDDGDAVSGATVQLLETGTTTVEATTTTDSNGLWYFTESDQDRYDVKITSGTSVRYVRWDDQVSFKELDVRNNTGNTTPVATFTNLTNNAANQVAVFSGANSTKADGDEIYLSFKLADSAGNIDEFARITAEATDVTSGSEDGQIRFGVIVAGTLTDVFTINSTTGGATSISYEIDSFTIKGEEGGAGILYLMADQGDDAGDEWRINVADAGVLTLGNDIASAGSYVDHMTLTPNSTIASSSVTFPGILDVNGSVDWDVSDVQVDSSGDIDLVSTNDAAAAIYLRENAGTSGTIKIHADQGTSVTEGAESVNILSDAGGVGIRSTANLAKAINITSDGGTTGSIAIFNDQGTSVTEGAESISLLSDAGGVGIRSTANLANAVNLTVDGGTSSTMTLFNDQGTAATEGAASIQLLSDVGGINLKSGLNGANAILLTADGGTSETIVIHADQGTGAASIAAVSDAGGITLDAGLDIVLSADGGNVTMDDGTSTIFDFNVDDTTLTIHDDQDTGDKAVITMAQHGALSIVTTDDDAAAANIQITADGTAELAGTTVTLDSAADIELEATNDINVPVDVGLTFGDDGEKIEGDGTNLVVESSGTLDMNSGGVLTLDSGAAINIEPASGSAILLDGTISVDAGVVTGATAITSETIDATTDFTIGDTVITNGVITDSSGLSLAAAVDLGSNTLTSTGSMQIRTIDYSDGDLAMTIADGGGVTFAQDATFSGAIDVDGTTNLDNTDIDGTLVVDGSNISLDSTSTLNIDNSNTSNGVTIATATSGVPISIGHTTSETTINDNLTVTGYIDLGGAGDIRNVGAAGNDWTTNALTLAGGSSSQKIKTETTGSGVNADFEAKIPASSTGNASMIFTQGSGDGSANNQEFRFAYQASQSYFRFRNEQLGADVWRNNDGDETMDGNLTWDTEVFDEEDDAMVLYRAYGVEHKEPVYEQGKQILKNNFEELISLGILRRYDDGWVGYNDQRMAPLFAGGIYQNRFRMDTQFAELDARLKKLETRS